jgi:hypothetical protein
MAAARKKAKRKAKKKVARRKVARRTAGRAAVARPRVPARKKGESAVAYHDRLADLIYEAEKSGDYDVSEALQHRAGALARGSDSIARPRLGAKKKRRGPGSYPWYECIDDQMGRYGDPAKAAAVCGRIRADSRKRYPVYWSARGLGRRPNPAEGDYAIYANPDDSGWHWWVQDTRSGTMAGASAKPHRTEMSAMTAAKRAARAHQERLTGRAVKNGTAPSGSKTGSPAARSGRRLPSMLTRI